MQDASDGGNILKRKLLTRGFFSIALQAFTKLVKNSAYYR